MSAAKNKLITGQADLRTKLALALHEVAWQGKKLDSVLERYAARFTRSPESKGQGPLFHEILYGSVRYFQQLQQISLQLLDKPFRKKDADLWALLIVGLYQLRYLKVKDHAIVNETVAATRSLGKEWAKGLINACLRRYQREGEQLEERLGFDKAFIYSHPGWLLKKIEADWPGQSKAILVANNTKPPIFLRINRRRVSQKSYLEVLDREGYERSPVLSSEDGIEVRGPVRVTELPGYQEGWFSVQDAAAQLCGESMQLQSGQRVLDACAAPGGKLAHILEILGDNSEVWAIEQSRKRHLKMVANLDRLGLSANLVQADAGKTDSWWDGRPFDRILLDAPCSTTGVIRRNPDIKIHRRAEDIDTIREIQGGLIHKLWPLLNQGGKLLYVTCSILLEENEHQVRTFVEKHDDAMVAPIPHIDNYPGVKHKLAHGYQILPGENNMDGFYYACVEKK